MFSHWFKETRISTVVLITMKWDQILEINCYFFSVHSQVFDAHVNPLGA